MEIGGLSSQLSNITAVKSEQTAAAQSELRLPFSDKNQDTVTLTSQAQVLNKLGESNAERLEQQRENLKPEEDNQSEQINSDFVRVSSSLGKAASSYGLSQQQAIELYEKIDGLI